MNKPEFNLGHQYQLYLQRVGLKESQMHPTQRIETKRAFMGACGQMLILLRDDVGALEEAEALNAYEYLMNQVGDFWLTETKRVN